MIKIKICDMFAEGACSFYRGIGSMSMLHKLDSEISVDVIQNVSWNSLIDADILYLIRPTTPEYIRAIEYAQSFGIKVWSDYDDALHLIPDYNPSYNYHTDPGVKKRTEAAINNSDIVTVSTQIIADCYWNLNPDIKIVENAFNDYHYKFERKKYINKNIVWRGTETHREDVLQIKDQITNVMNKNSDWNFIYIGENLWYIVNKFKNKNYYYQKTLDIVKYLRFIYNLNPSVAIIPLLKNYFNYAKSNCSWIEATFSGATCLAPDLPEFQKPGIVNYSTPEKFEYFLEKIMTSKNFCNENYEKSFDYIKNNLMLSEINKKRIKIIRDALK